MQRWQSLFLGREKEIEQLTAAWEKAKSGNPQLAILMGHPGLGKTRIVQEFYSILSTSDDGIAEDGYWPDKLPRDRDALKINPFPEDCNGNQAMTYLWWGLKLVDNGNNYAGSSDMHFAVDQFLQPHLEPMRRAVQIEKLSEQKKQEIKEGAKDTAKIAVETSVGAFPVLGPAIVAAYSLFISVSKRLKNRSVIQKQKEELQKDVAPGAVAQKDAETFEDRVIKNLSDYIAHNTDAPHPITIVIDDAQFSDNDPATFSFIKRLTGIAWKENWPLLLLMTFWPDRWNSGVDNEHLLPFHIANKSAMDDNFSWQRVALNSLKGLDEMITTAIPEIPEEQLQLILEKTDGNPRYLERVLQWMVQSPAMFEKRSAKGALTEEAIATIVDEKFDIHDVTRRLYEAAPIEARQAAALASMQGQRFICKIVEDVASEMDIPGISAGLHHCESPLAVVDGIDTGTGEFAQGIFRQVANTLLSRVVGFPKAVEDVFYDILKPVLDDWDDFQNTSGIEREQTLNLVIEIFGGKEAGSRELILAGRAFLHLLGLSLERDDIISARSQLEAWKEGEALGRWQEDDCSTEEFNQSILLGMKLGDYENAYTMAVDKLSKVRKLALEENSLEKDVALIKSLDVSVEITSRLYGLSHAAIFSREMEKLSKELFEKNETHKAQILAAEFLLKVSIFNEENNDYEKAYEVAKNSVQILRNLCQKINSVEVKRELAFAIYFLARVVQKVDGPEAARELFEESTKRLEIVTSENNSLENRTHLAVSIFYLAQIIQILEGPRAAKPLIEDYTDRMRVLSRENNSPKSNKELAFAIYHLAVVMQSIKGPKAARPLLMEYEKDIRVLAEKYKTPELRKDSAVAISELAKNIQTLDGAQAAHSLFIDSVNKMQALVDEKNTEELRELLAERIFLLASNTESLYGPEAAKPLYEKSVGLFSEHKESPRAQNQMAYGLFHLGKITEELSGPELSKPYIEKYVRILDSLNDSSLEMRFEVAMSISHLADITRKVDGEHIAMPLFIEFNNQMQMISQEHETPQYRAGHAFALKALAEITEIVDGPEEAKQLYEKSVEKLRALSKEQMTTKLQEQLSDSIYYLARNIQRVDGDHAAKPIFEDYTQRIGSLVEQHDLPKYRLKEAIAISILAGVVQKVDGSKVAISLYEDYVMKMRVLEKEYKVPEYKKQLAFAISHLADVTQNVEGPELAKPLYEEWTQTMRELAEQQNTPENRKELAFAIYHLASITETVDGPVEAKLLYQDYLEKMESLAQEHNTIEHQKQLAFAILRFAEITQKVDEPVVAKPLYIDYVQRMKVLAEEHNTIENQKQLAFAIHSLAEFTHSSKGPEAAKPVYEDYMQRIQNLAEAQNIPEHQKQLAFAFAYYADFIQCYKGPKKSQSYYDKYAEHINELAKAQSNPEHRKQLGLAFLRLANQTLALHGPLAALPQFDEAVEIVRKLSEEVTTPEFQLNVLACKKDDIVARSLGANPWGQAFSYERRPSETALSVTIEMQQLVIDINELILSQKTAEFIGWRGLILSLLADLELSIGDYDKALNNAKDSLSDLQRYARQVSKTKAQGPLGRALVILGRAKSKTNDLEGAVEDYYEALPLIKNEARIKPYPTTRELAVLLWFLAEALEKVGQSEEANEYLLEGLATAKAFAGFEAQDGKMILEEYVNKLGKPLVTD